MRKSAAQIAGAVMEGQLPPTQDQSTPPESQSASAPKKAPSKYPEFPVPSNFQPPSGVQPNEDFKAVGTFRMKDNGSMCLIAVDGSPVGKESPSQPY